ncbi:N-acetyltransferase [Prosthecochloris sp. ZM_2]|uniref:GNAT family N-acetyltransferase n=1 Tax=Prosthecochloris sp. ZM_2 TaxID=2045206 RepID=UPI000DF7D440|nr:N-acetyltransferase [Prosthecochloris sp. ZM_2]RNA64902.1 N-acetyltransferase [Prosthecochloris sp. ZM_2]
MLPNPVIRDETSADVEEITRVTVAAFQDLAVSSHNEQDVIIGLREAGALAVSLVAESAPRIIGHIAFSPVKISDGTPSWYGLGPVSVLPKYQRQGVGRALIEEGLLRLRRMEARGCCLVGHPEYYGRFGFEHVQGLVFEGAPPEAFFVLSFDGHVPRGTLTFHDAFTKKSSGQEPLDP